jgi:hypothetical protein
MKIATSFRYFLITYFKFEAVVVKDPFSPTNVYDETTDLLKARLRLVVENSIEIDHLVQAAVVALSASQGNSKISTAWITRNDGNVSVMSPLVCY